MQSFYQDQFLWPIFEVVLELANDFYLCEMDDALKSRLLTIKWVTL